MREDEALEAEDGAPALAVLLGRPLRAILGLTVARLWPRFGPASFFVGGPGAARA